MRAFFAEMAGTFVLVAASCAAATLGGWPGTPIAIGAVVALLILAFGRLSGAHFNPAVTLAIAASGAMPARRALLYVAAQLIAALAAAALVQNVAGPGIGLVEPGAPPTLAWAADTIGSFAMVFVILAVVAGRIPGRWGALAIGLAVAAALWLTIPLSGGSLNPARALAPALLAGRLDAVAVTVGGPLCGALLAVVAHRATEPARLSRVKELLDREAMA
ncbi:MAG: aquaporin [Candidatus Thermoplasmatota archaeon]